MSQYKSKFLNVLSERGFIHQISDPEALDAALLAETVSAYIGFDCTAPSLHVGNLVQIMMLYWMQQTGHRPVCLMGGGTTMIGDPSGKDESRQLLTPEKIEENKEGIKKIFARLLTFGDGPREAIMPDNAEWLLKLNYVELLRTAGRYISVNEMIKRDSVRMRLEREQHLSFLEFNYMVLQAYDFVELNRRYGVTLQMGGSDQWGNIVSGIDLGRKMAETRLFALTTPLLATSSGAKMGKTASGAVWLNPDMLGPYDYWQYWRNCEDADVGRFLRLFTILPMEQIRDLEVPIGSNLNKSKEILATEATAIIHGRVAAKNALETAHQTFGQGKLSMNLPTTRLPVGDFESGVGILSANVAIGFASTNSEARRQVRSGAVKINDVVCTDEGALITNADLNSDGVVKISFGKKKHALLRRE